MRRKKDAGFSLIELMVVVLVIAVLLAIAIPTFLGSRERAQERSAQARLRNAYTAQQVYYAGNRYFTQRLLDVQAIEPSLQWDVLDSGEPTSEGLVYIDAPGLSGNNPTPGEVKAVKAQTILLATKSEAGTCWWIQTVASPGLPKYAKNDCSNRPTDADDFGFKWPKL